MIIKGNLPTSLCDSITLVDTRHLYKTRNQDFKQLNVTTVRTKTSGTNSIKSKSVNIWNEINKQFLAKQLIHQKKSYCKSLNK